MGTIVGSILNPLSLTPALWIDFSDASTVSLSGSDITQVNDRSGNARHFTGTAGLRPTYETAVQNGLNVARFNGTNDVLHIGTTGLLRNVSGATIYALYKWASSPTAVRQVVSIRTGTSGAGNQIRAALGGGLSANKITLIGRTLDADSASTATSTANASSVFFIHTGLFDYANTDLYQYDGATQDGSNTAFGAATATSNTDSLTASLGAGRTSAGTNLQWANCDIAEVLVYHSAHDAATRQRVWSYLRTKWGI